MSQGQDVDFSLKMLYVAQRACPNITYMINHPTYRKLQTNEQRAIDILQWACLTRQFDPNLAECLPTTHEIDHALIPKVSNTESIQVQQQALRKMLIHVDQCLFSHRQEIQPIITKAHQISNKISNQVYQDGVIIPRHEPDSSLQISEQDNEVSVDKKVRIVMEGDCKSLASVRNNSASQNKKLTEQESMNIFVDNKKLNYCLLGRLCYKQLQKCLNESTVGNFEACITRGEVADCLYFEE